MVGRAGIEPALPKKQDFKSCVSTNFTTAPQTRKATVFYKTHINKAIFNNMEARAGIEPA
jgi:hypothetical protein